MNRIVLFFCLSLIVKVVFSQNIFFAESIHSVGGKSVQSLQQMNSYNQEFQFDSSRVLSINSTLRFSQIAMSDLGFRWGDSLSSSRVKISNFGIHNYNFTAVNFSHDKYLSKLFSLGLGVSGYRLHRAELSDVYSGVLQVRSRIQIYRRFVNQSIIEVSSNKNHLFKSTFCYSEDLYNVDVSVVYSQEAFFVLGASFLIFKTTELRFTYNDYSNEFGLLFLLNKGTFRSQVGLRYHPFLGISPQLSLAHVF